MQRGLIRFFDIVFSLFSLFVFSPFMLIIALAIAVSMGIPVIFAQKRLGYEGSPFTVFKFRSMVDKAIDEGATVETVNEYAVKIKNDPRITSLGAFIRRTSLDELPQFWNVLKGDMSVVGPRPWVPQEYDVIPKEWHIRLKAKPGITGLAQINGRSDLAMDKIVEYDLIWVNKQTVAHYFTIIVKTFFYTLKMKNVY